MRRLLVVLLVALVACGSSDPGVRDVSVADAVKAAGETAVVVLDVRTAEEFAAGHLAGARNLDVQDAAFGTKVGALDHDAAYLVYCASGNRSRVAADQMDDLGFTDVRNVAGGGFDALVAAGAAVDLS